MRGDERFLKLDLIRERMFSSCLRLPGHGISPSKDDAALRLSQFQVRQDRLFKHLHKNEIDPLDANNGFNRQVF